MIRIIINGAFGKMGTLATQTLRQQSDFEIIAELGHKDDLAHALITLKPDVLLDLTNAEAIQQIMPIIIQSKIPTVIGTTGLSAESIDYYKKQADAQKQGIILAPNFSIGVLLMMKYAADAAHYFHEAEIIEMHHREKIDAPSGTAARTVRMMAEHINPIPIHSVRLSGKMAHQHVIFGGQGECLTLQHDALNRECFMPGLLIACRAVSSLDHFVEGLENILWPINKK